MEAEMNCNYCYHGTTAAGITKLQANPVVYLTPDRAYALFYIIDKDINWVTCGVREDGIIQYDEQFPDQLEKLYGGKGGYLYKCLDTGLFTPGKSREIVVSEKDIEVECCGFIPDVYQEIRYYVKTGKVVVNRYENQSQSENERIFNMMVNYIFKNDLISSDGSKGAFIRENFPASWEYAISHYDEKSHIMEEWEQIRRKDNR